MTAGQIRTVLITGANRGLGLELSRQLRAAGDLVIATCRNPAVETANAFLPLDTGDPASIAALAEHLAGATIDVLVNNAAILGDTGGLASLEEQGFLDVMRVNALGPLLMVKSFLPHLRRSPKPIVANISSRVGTVAGLDNDGDYAYRCSKAALNMANAKLAHDYRDVTFLGFHPGWIKTDMGGVDATVDVAVSAAGIRQILASARLEDSGSFRDYRGQHLSV